MAHSAFELISRQVLPVSDDVNTSGCTNHEPQGFHNAISTMTKKGRGVGKQVKKWHSSELLLALASQNNDIFGVF